MLRLVKPEIRIDQPRQPEPDNKGCGETPGLFRGKIAKFKKKMPLCLRQIEIRSINGMIARKNI